MRAFPVVVLLSVVNLSVENLSPGSQWEVGLATVGGVELVSSDGLVSMVSRVDGGTRALTFDPIHQALYLAQSAANSTSLYALLIDPLLPNYQPTLLYSVGGKSVSGLAFDVVKSSLYWSTGIQGTVKALRVDLAHSAPRTVLTLPDQHPHGLAIDPCSRKLYWANVNVESPSIGVAGLDGAEPRKLIFHDLDLPTGLTISHSEAKLYWADEKSGGRYSIERCSLDGSSREVVASGHNQQTESIALSRGVLYWSDWQENCVWKYRPGMDTEPALLRKYTFQNRPRSLVSLSRDDPPPSQSCPSLVNVAQQAEEKCGDGGRWLPGQGCLCSAWYTGTRCQIHRACINYCHHNSTCRIDGEGGAVCECGLGRRGSRCEIDMCSVEYCMNSGECRMGEGGDPFCLCPSTHLGDRCQFSKEICPLVCTAQSQSYPLLFNTCRCLESVWRVDWPRSEVIIGEGALIVVLLVAVVALAYKSCKLSKRPKLKRRFGPPSSKHQPPPLQEIAIENCCNMNICETPCYEAEFRTVMSSSKKEEKRELLDNMEEGEASEEPRLTL